MSRDLKMLESFIKELEADRKVLEQQRIFKDKNGNRKLYKDLDFYELKANNEIHEQISALNMQIMEKKAKIECIELEKQGFKKATIYKDYESDTVYLNFENKEFVFMKEYSAYGESVEWVVDKNNKSDMKDLKELLEEMPKFYTNTIKLKGVR